MDCGDPPELRNGSISNMSMNTTLNSTVTYECDDGFEFIGVIGITCLASGNWSNRDSVCSEFYTPNTLRSKGVCCHLWNTSCFKIAN